ncbi:MAG: carboxypeptidase regulatory-like domain-containing protein [Clostridiales bacterium]|nr:carboxypeptidase regulatory-like domain-containing protein [Clostridiales bacterium]PWM66973.1 MAG: hypothetical protein DBX61_06270 [Clostridiales bacterium]
MRKIAALLLCFCLLCVSSVNVFAENIVSADETGGDAAISVTVPDSHTITVDAENAQVIYGSRADDSFSVERLSAPRLLIRPENGYRITRVTLNGEDITEQGIGGYYTLEPVYEDQTLTVEAESVPSNPDSTHDVSGTITDEDGEPIPGVTVDIGGQTGVTDEDGSFTIPNVPDGYHPVTITDEDGNIIGYTEVEISEGEPSVTQKADGSWALTAPKDGNFSIELTVKDDGTLSVDKVTAEEIQEEPQSESDAPQTGISTDMLLWWVLLAVSAGCVALVLMFRKRTKAK